MRGALFALLGAISTVNAADAATEDPASDAFSTACAEQGGWFDQLLWDYDAQDWTIASSPDQWFCVFAGQCSQEETDRGCTPENLRVDADYKVEYVPAGYCECPDASGWTDPLTNEVEAEGAAAAGAAADAVDETGFYEDPQGSAGSTAGAGAGTAGQGGEQGPDGESSGDSAGATGDDGEGMGGVGWA